MIPFLMTCVFAAGCVCWVGRLTRGGRTAWTRAPIKLFQWSVLRCTLTSLWISARHRTHSERSLLYDNSGGYPLAASHTHWAWPAHHSGVFYTLYTDTERVVNVQLGSLNQHRQMKRPFRDVLEIYIFLEKKCKNFVHRIHSYTELQDTDGAV